MVQQDHEELRNEVERLVSARNNARLGELVGISAEQAAEWVLQLQQGMDHIESVQEAQGRKIEMQDRQQEELERKFERYDRLKHLRCNGQPQLQSSKTKRTKCCTACERNSCATSFVA